MTIKAITPDYAVATRMTEADLAEAALSGYRTVVCLLPDREEEAVPASLRLGAAAADLGLNFFHVPVVVGLITEADIARFAKVLERAEEPVLAFCHSGLRAALMWALARRGDGAESAELAARIGVDIAPYLDDAALALAA